MQNITWMDRVSCDQVLYQINEQKNKKSRGKAIVVGRPADLE